MKLSDILLGTGVASVGSVVCYGWIMLLECLGPKDLMCILAALLLFIGASIAEEK